MVLRSDRKDDRFIRRIETEFSAEDNSHRGISTDLSITGLFIRTNHPFAPGSIIDITLHLPEGETSKLRGKVMRAHKTPMVGLKKNGMGILLLEKDAHYINFVKEYISDIQENAPPPEPQEKSRTEADYTIISCPQCGAKNKVMKSKLSLSPKCGKCRSPLIILA